MPSSSAHRQATRMESSRPTLVVVEQVGHVLSIKLNRESKKNAFTLEMYGELVDTLLAAEKNESVHVVLLSGGPRIFSAGNDINDFIASPPVEDDAAAWRFIRSLSTFSKPIVAAVNGAAIGIGATLLLHCDLVYAANNSKFSMPFVNLGLSPEAGSSLLLQQISGPRAAAELLLLGNQFNAERARQIQLVTALLEPSEVYAHAMARAQELAAKPISALVTTKRLLRTADVKRLAEQVHHEIESFRTLVVQDAAKLAFATFVAT